MLERQEGLRGADRRVEASARPAESLLRLPVGLEGAEDLIADLDGALSSLR